MFELSILKYQLKTSPIPEQQTNSTNKVLYMYIIQFFNEIKVDCFDNLMAVVCLSFYFCYETQVLDDVKLIKKKYSTLTYAC